MFSSHIPGLKTNQGRDNKPQGESPKNYPSLKCDKYNYDHNLEYTWTNCLPQNKPISTIFVSPAPYPEPKDFIYFSALAYCRQKHLTPDFDKGEFDEEKISILKNPPPGFELFVIARNKKILNGYFGFAHVNWEKRQIILAHRGTKLKSKSVAGALIADSLAVVVNQFSPQIPSAFTFAYEMSKFAANNNLTLFLTGHSLGGWLASLTCFSTEFLKLDESGNYFVKKDLCVEDFPRHYTVTFDAPGSDRFMRKLKRNLFPLNDEATQFINIESLPIENFIFYPNLINSRNFHVGTTFLVNVEQVGVDTSKSFGFGTHPLKPVLKLLNEKPLEECIKCRVVAYQVKPTELVENDWDEDGRSDKWDPRRFSINFFTREELKFLKNIQKEQGQGRFRGQHGEEVKIAKSILG